MAKKKSGNKPHGTIVPKSKKESEPQLGIFALGLRKDEVSHFIGLYRKFKKSLEWIIKHPERADKATRERFFSTVVEPMDNVWEKMSSDTRQTLIRRKVV